MFPINISKTQHMLNSQVVPSLELLSHDFPNIKLLRGFRYNTLEVERNFVDRRRAQGAEAEMDGCGALDFQRRAESRWSPGLRWVLPVCACR